MEFMCFSHLPWPEGTEPRQIFEDTTEQIQYAEELGFASAWLAEHHFSRYGLGSSGLVLAAQIAARTKRIRLGTAVLVPPLHHPIRLAEDIATELERGQSGRRVEFAIQGDLVAEGDRRLLRLALENLLGNAIKFTSKEPEAKIEFGVTEGEVGVPAYYVRDNGVGFDHALTQTLKVRPRPPRRADRSRR